MRLQAYLVAQGAIDDARVVAREVTAELLTAFGGQADPAAIDAAVDQRLKRAA